jgi:hypothetical protein
MSEAKPWSPKLGQSKEFRDHANPSLDLDRPSQLPLDTEDTAPLQGSKDLSDNDSLEDVIADSVEPEDRVARTAPPRKSSP